MSANIGLNEIHVGEHGFRFTIIGSEDITGHSKVEIKFKKPDGTTTTETGSVVSAADAEFYVSVPEGLFDLAGGYVAQGIVTFASKVLKTRPISFSVNPSV